MQKFPGRTYLFHAGTNAFQEINYEFYIKQLGVTIKNKL